jgi:hypothetical protein
MLLHVFSFSLSLFITLGKLSLAFPLPFPDRVLAVPFSLTLEIVQTLMNITPFLFLMSTNVGVSSESWTESFEAIAELAYKF